MRFAKIMNKITKKLKNVSFAPGTKEDYETKEHIRLYYKVIEDYFNNKIKTVFDIYRIIYCRKHTLKLLINYFLHESRILLDKLKTLKKEEIMFNTLEKFFKSNPRSPTIMDLVWDTTYFIERVEKNQNKSIPILRRGHRKLDGKLTSTHIPFLEKLIKLLIDTQKFIEEISS